MAEVNTDAMALISISWQALTRVIQGNKDTELCDCTIMILFAGFFIEANLNYIIDNMKTNQQMRQFLKIKKKDRYPGLQLKLGWFYNEYVARDKAINRDDPLFHKAVIRRKLGRKFPGYCTISHFRNKISHGYIDPSIANPENALKLRKQAKDIGPSLPRYGKGQNSGTPDKSAGCENGK